MTDDFVVSTEWLAEHLDDPAVRVLDVSGYLDDEGANAAHEHYLTEHIRGAVWFDVASSYGELSDPASDLWWTWPSLARIEDAMSRAGVDSGTTVVITARTFEERLGLGTMWCTRAWWTLHHSGVSCAILDGGNERWASEGRPTASGPVAVEQVVFRGVDRRREAIADKNDVLAALDNSASCVIDALPAVSYAGERVNYARPGHITGAANLPYSTFIEGPTASFVSVEQAREVFDEAGMFDVERAVLY